MESRELHRGRIALEALARASSELLAGTNWADGIGVIFYTSEEAPDGAFRVVLAEEFYLTDPRTTSDPDPAA